MGRAFCLLFGLFLRLGEVTLAVKGEMRAWCFVVEGPEGTELIGYIRIFIVKFI